MSTSMSKNRRPAYYTVRETAWILGIEQSRVSRAIRLGELRAVARNGRVLVSGNVLARLLGEPGDSGSGGAQ
ncbi:helix-turn-helix domain-containing protein [Amycolatopsis taiwanensis]|uniref:helix-turn-helix domain-containing protein n=1 Tax=Amycolatopsis taiwanensis TaxID=342230 RepID=UPI00146F98AC|nr:helix-turn-helix domain-containing protein [Amycolatopsis taiwanensis]